MRIRIQNKKKVTAAAIGALVIVAGGAGLAGAVTSSGVPTYTGCLGTSGSADGKLLAVAVGSSPTRACTSNEQLVRLSSGDITSVAGGQAVRVTSTPLGTPDSEGDVSLDLAPQYKLPQGCADGSVPKRSGGTWSCQTLPTLGGAYVGYTGYTYRQVGDDWSVLGDGMELPAGSYTLAAKVIVHGGLETDNFRADCRLDATGSQAIDASYAFDEDNIAAASVALAGAVTKQVPFRVSVVCRDAGNELSWNELRIVATPVNGFTNVNLGD